jgi:hypothetical protein
MLLAWLPLALAPHSITALLLGILLLDLGWPAAMSAIRGRFTASARKRATG